MANHFLCLVILYGKASQLVGFVKNFTSSELAGKMSTQECNRKAVSVMIFLLNDARVLLFAALRWTSHAENLFLGHQVVRGR